ncbi:hypothetical protein ACIQ2D_19645 [Lysinibacillus sp. NPDC097287]|uniref:hypothetical protein n=1 Tax=Lysinibacillus sp. NPDC097287 TaxID=3364144 RepID=UPI0037F75AAF
MDEKKLAQLSQEQLDKINDLEQKIGVTLIAYDQQVIQQGDRSSMQDNHSS